MELIVRWFHEHPASVGESYSEHATFAAGVGARMVLAGLACIIHGVLPFVFIDTGSRCIRGLNDTLTNRRKHPASRV